MGNLTLVIKVGVERGEELFNMSIEAENAGAFLQYLGSQLRAAGIATRPVKATPVKGTAAKEWPAADKPGMEV